LIDEINEIASLFVNNSSSLCLSVCVCVCVADWSRREWCRVTYIHWRQVASVLVSWQQRWHIGRWP